MKPTDVAFIAGFFEGEGCISYQRSRTRQDGVTPTTPVISIGQKDPRTLEWIQGTLGMGNLYHDSRCSTLRIIKLAHVREFVRLTYPYVRNSSKRAKMKAAYHKANRSS